jgi:hypothetical protein
MLKHAAYNNTKTIYHNKNQRHIYNFMHCTNNGYQFLYGDTLATAQSGFCSELVHTSATPFMFAVGFTIRNKPNDIRMDVTPGGTLSAIKVFFEPLRTKHNSDDTELSKMVQRKILSELYVKMKSDEPTEAI